MGTILSCCNSIALPKLDIHAIAALRKVFPISQSIPLDPQNTSTTPTFYTPPQPSTRTTSDTVEMAQQPPSLTTLPTELHLKLLETIPNLSDLISLLNSSPHFATLFRKYHRSILTHTLLPRLNPQNPDAVAQALQAACSGGTFHCRLPDPAFPPPPSLASEKVASSWFLPHENNIWHESYAGDPLAILPVLRDLDRETKNFRRMVSAHRQGQGLKRPLPLSRAKQESLVWELQTQTLRCANTRSVRWDGPTAASQRQRAETCCTRPSSNSGTGWAKSSSVCSSPRTRWPGSVRAG